MAYSQLNSVCSVSALRLSVSQKIRYIRADFLMIPSMHVFIRWRMFCLSAALFFIAVWSHAQSRLISERVPQTVAFGSCNFQFDRQEYWKEVAKNNPDLWIWLGDNIYGDTHDTAVLRRKYVQQMNNTNYLEFKKHTPIVGTWDDHDMGVNDADRYYEHKAFVKDLFWNLMEEAPDSPLRMREGVYSSVLLGPPGKRVKIILTDLRYLKQKPGKDSSMLGEGQWAWLEKELLESDAEINIIGSGIQFLSKKKLSESWTEFPTDRDRLWQLLEKQGKYNTIIISGDIHSAELLRCKYPNDKTRELFEFTSSGLTHSSWFFPIEENGYTAETDFFGKNYGIIRFSFEPRLTVRFEIKNMHNQTVRELVLGTDEKGRLTLP